MTSHTKAAAAISQPPHPGKWKKQNVRGATWSVWEPNILALARAPARPLHQFARGPFSGLPELRALVGDVGQTLPAPWEHSEKSSQFVIALDFTGPDEVPPATPDPSPEAREVVYGKVAYFLAPERERERAQEPRAAGVPITCIAALHFADGTLQPGDELEQVEPTQSEINGRSKNAGGLAEDAATDLMQRPWGVVEWRGLRRRVPLTSFVRADGAALEATELPKTKRAPSDSNTTSTPRAVYQELFKVDFGDIQQPSDDWALEAIYRGGWQLVPLGGGRGGERGGGSWMLTASADRGDTTTRLTLYKWLKCRSEGAVEWETAQRRAWDDLVGRQAAVSASPGIRSTRPAAPAGTGSEVAA